MFADSNNNIIEALTPEFVAKVNASKVSLGMHHNRTDPPRRSTFNYKRKDGEINRISIVITKGEIMSDKGKGGRGQDKRVKKEFFNVNAEPFVEELANEIAANTGDIICRNLCI